jgi:hypothetical protein
MAIDFGRMIQGVATGAMGQYNAEVAAKDKMKGNIIERAGLNFYENTLPKFQKTEKNRKAAYDKLSSIYSPEVAEFFGEQGLITGDGNDLDVISKQIKDRGIDKDYIKNYVKQQGSSYNQRYEARVKDIQEQEAFVMGNLEKNQFGSMTAKLLVGQDKDTATDTTAASTMSTETQVPEIQTQAPETETITTEGTMVPGTPIKTMDTTEEFPVDATKITGDFDKAFPLERNNLELSVPEIQKLYTDSDKSFDNNIVKKYGSNLEQIPDNSPYLKGYDPKEHGPDRKEYAIKMYRQSYMADIIDTYKQQVSETQVSSKFAIPEGTKVSDIVIQARERIAQISNGTGSDDQKDASIEELKTIVSGQLNSMGIEPGKFGF